MISNEKCSNKWKITRKKSPKNSDKSTSQSKKQKRKLFGKLLTVKAYSKNESPKTISIVHSKHLKKK